ncbi:hypothetical protein Tco_0057140, partial [Tanacetum coccineum]
SSKRKVWKPTGKVFINIGYTWRPTGRTFTIEGNARPLTRITTTVEVPLRKPTIIESDTPKPVVTLVYSRKPRKSKTNVPDSKSNIPRSVRELINILIMAWFRIRDSRNFRRTIIAIMSAVPTRLASTSLTKDTI